MDTVTDDADRPDTASGAGTTVANAETAFSRLGDETRLRTIRTLAAEGPQPFTALFEASSADTTAGFAYHLRQLADHYVEKRSEDREEPRYHLTSAGRAVARALDAGTYTDRVARGPEHVDGDCPVCGTGLLALPFPPGGARDRTLPEILDAFDSYHRRRLSLVVDGVCPDCAGPIHGEIEAAEAPEAAPADEQRPVVAADCEGCPFEVSAPVSLFVRESAEVASFVDDHGLDPGPIWNLGSEWRETVLSTEPWAVRVSVHVEDAVLDLLVGDGPTVVDASRSAVESAEAAA